MSVRRLIYFGVLGFAICGRAHAEARALHSHRLAGGNYIAASELAECYGLGRNTSHDADRAEYHNAFGQISLQAERHEIQLNGIQHWLSAPVIAARGQLWLTALDVLKTVDPVLRQGRTRTPVTVRNIVLDPGHGGSDRGTRGVTGLEKELTLDLARRVERLLEAGGLDVALTRTSDRTLSLQDRVDFADHRNADLFVSLHFNSGGSAEGVETYCVSPAGAGSTANLLRRFFSGDTESCPGNRYDEHNVWLAHCIQSSLVRSAGVADRGVRRARFYVLRYMTCPAVLVEAGFLSNRTEEQRVLSADHRDRLAKAIAGGILQYRTSAEKP